MDNKGIEHILFSLLFHMEFVLASPTVNFDIWDDKKELLPLNNIGEEVAPENLTRMARVLNFLPVPVEEECLSNDKRRNGICMNTYECRIQSGISHGPCALGFGVCCVFTATCNQEAFNNITYFVNPDFPDLSHEMPSYCSLKVEKLPPDVSQLRLDFIHFNLGQPNRRTGVCEEDVFILRGGTTKELRLCGLNSGHHVYFDVENVDGPISITVNLPRKAVSRLWEVRVLQIPFSQRAPVGCLQYHLGTSGVIQTMNFADNGRHLAEQSYNICMRQEEGMCSIVYEPCHENSFRISPNNENGTEVLEDVGSGNGPTLREMDACNDKIILPCDSEDLLMPRDAGPGFCEVVHCGTSLCPDGPTPCRIESSMTPFTVGVHFGPSAREESPEENLGMCLTYQQTPCME